MTAGCAGTYDASAAAAAAEAEGNVQRERPTRKQVKRHIVGTHLGDAESVDRDGASLKSAHYYQDADPLQN